MADLAGPLLAFIVAQLWLGAGDALVGMTVLVAMLPVWNVGSLLYGL